MIIRNKEGKIIILNKNNYTSDKIYNKIIYNKIIYDKLKINNNELNENNNNNNTLNYSDFLIKNILKK
jgi:hypothetical protein